MKKNFNNGVVANNSNNAPQIFSNEQFGSVRIIMQDNGEPLFCLKDVCDCLDLSNYRNVATRLEAEDVNSMDTPTEGGIQEMLFITESGLYDAILGARKNPNTKPFKKWVTKEVLPSIRKTGSYNVNMPALPQTFAEALRMLADKVDENKALTSKLIITEDELKRYQDRFEGVLTRGEWAKKLKQEGLDVNERRTKNSKKPSITEILESMGITEWIDNTTEVAKQEYVDRGWFVNVQKRGTNGFPSVTTYITVKGQKELTPKVHVWIVKQIDCKLKEIYGNGYSKEMIDLMANAELLKMIQA